jgi:hypothetical protein
LIVTDRGWAPLASVPIGVAVMLIGTLARVVIARDGGAV